MKPVYHPRAGELASLLVHQREKVLKVSVSEITRRGGPTKPTCLKYEAGLIPIRVNVETLDRLDAGYGLERGTARFILEPSWDFLQDLEVILMTHLQAGEETVKRLQSSAKDSKAANADGWLRTNDLMLMLLAGRQSGASSDVPAALPELEVLSIEEA